MPCVKRAACIGHWRTIWWAETSFPFIWYYERYYKATVIQKTNIYDPLILNHVVRLQKMKEKAVVTTHLMQLCLGLKNLHTFLLLSYLSQETQLYTQASHFQLCRAHLCCTLCSWHWLVILEHMGHLRPQPSQFLLCSVSSLSGKRHSGTRWTCTGPCLIDTEALCLYKHV